MQSFDSSLGPRSDIPEHANGRCLARVRVADDHEAVAHQNGLVQLRDLLEEDVGRLQLEVCARLEHGVAQHSVIGLRSMRQTQRAHTRWANETLRRVYSHIY